MKTWIIAGLVTSLAGGALSSFDVSARANGLEVVQEPPSPATLRAERWYAGGVRAMKAGRKAEALALFERAIPLKGMSPNLLYNLAQVSWELKQWPRVLLYAQAFQQRERGTKDAVSMHAYIDRARGELERLGTPAKPYRFALQPDAVFVLVDGVPVANAKVTVVYLPPGKHELSVKHDGYLPWSEPLVVPKAGGVEPVLVERTLVPMIFEAKVHIITAPADGVEVFVNEEKVGVTPLGELTLHTGRRYLFRFAKEGYDRWWRYIELARGEVLELRPVMERLPVGPAATAPIPLGMRGP